MKLQLTGGSRLLGPALVRAALVDDLPGPLLHTRLLLLLLLGLLPLPDHVLAEHRGLHLHEINRVLDEPDLGPVFEEGLRLLQPVHDPGLDAAFEVIAIGQLPPSLDLLVFLRQLASRLECRVDFEGNLVVGDDPVLHELPPRVVERVALVLHQVLRHHVIAVQHADRHLHALLIVGVVGLLVLAEDLCDVLEALDPLPSGAMMLSLVSQLVVQGLQVILLHQRVGFFLALVEVAAARAGDVLSFHVCSPFLVCQ